MYTTGNNLVICEVCLRSDLNCNCKQKLERTQNTIKRLPQYLPSRRKRKGQEEQDPLDDLNNGNG